MPEAVHSAAFIALVSTIPVVNEQQETQLVSQGCASIQGRFKGHCGGSRKRVVAVGLSFVPESAASGVAVDNTVTNITFFTQKTKIPKSYRYAAHMPFLIRASKFKLKYLTFFTCLSRNLFTCID